jgi:CubicO group peptidase (beta-lactamase class C family)
VKILRRAALLAAIVLAATAHAQLPVDLRGPWQEVTPDQVGLDAAQLEAAAARARAQPAVRSLLVARRGRLAFERYFGGATGETPFDVRSVTKSVVSLLTGIAIRDGVLPGTETSMAPYLAPAYQVDAEDATVLLSHLLTMTSGFQWDESTGNGYNDWIVSNRHVQYVLDRPHAAPPGASFVYNSGAVHLLGVVIERAAGRPLPEFAREKLFAPLGILDADVVWEPMANGHVNGGSGIDLRGRDLLKLGQLVLQRGFSGETSVVPEAWIAQATRPAFSWRQNYGAQQSTSYGGLFWVSDAQPGAAFAWGHGGQFVYVVPSLELVVVATTEWRGLAGITPGALAAHVLDTIVLSVLPAARPPL